MPVPVRGLRTPPPQSRPRPPRRPARHHPLADVARPRLHPAVADLRRALSEADYRGLLDPAAIECRTGRGRPGAAALRGALALHLPELAGTRSLLERHFLLLVERAGLPIPEVNATVEGLMVDALWRDARVVVELDGHAAHDSRAAAERDRHRDLALRAAGFVVLRYTWQQVAVESARVVADLHRVLVPANGPV
jgi:hypothetical protein